MYLYDALQLFLTMLSLRGYLSVLDNLAVLQDSFEGEDQRRKQMLAIDKSNLFEGLHKLCDFINSW